MPAHQSIQHCIQTCQQSANMLRSMSGDQPNPQVQKLLREAAHHLDLCVTECQFSLQQLPPTA